MTDDRVIGGRYILIPHRDGRPVTADEPDYGWHDLADALFRACDLADGAPQSSSWVIRDRVDEVDLVRIDITSRITYLA